MKKFPVISENGNEYLVRMGRGSLGFFFVDILEPYIGIFGKQRFKEIYTHMIEPADVDYDYVKLAKLAVFSCEEKKAENKRRQMTREQGVKKFEEWDGIINGEESK